MARATKGSQKWVQDLINDPVLRRKFDDEINKKLHTASILAKIEWKSPLKLDDYVEYRDEAFLKNLDFGPQKSSLLKAFWPKSGPRWDALGYTDIKIGEVTKRSYFLVEAKSHIGEIIKSCTATSTASISLISSSFSETQKWLGAKPLIDWKLFFYQYCNRLAHLFFFRDARYLKENAYLILIYIVNDKDFPTTLASWKTAINLEQKVIGCSPRKLKSNNVGVIEVFFDAVSGDFI